MTAAPTVFVVDDNVGVRKSLRALLESAGLAVETYASGDRRDIQLQAWAAKGMAEVAVRDTGTGVSATATGRMFEPFFTTKPHGLGMGLAISRSILEAHQGRIWVKSRVDGGHGTTVCFTLPLQPSKAARETGST